MDVEELYQVSGTMQLPFLGDDAEPYTPRLQEFEQLFLNTPTSSSTEPGPGRKPKVEDFVFTEDKDLDPLDYAYKYQFSEYLSEKGEAIAAECTVLWMDSYVRTNICGSFMRGESSGVIAAIVSERVRRRVSERVIASFIDLFWDLSPLSSRQILNLLGPTSPLADVAAEARGQKELIWEKLGLVEPTTSDRNVIETIKSIVSEGLHELHRKSPLIGTRDLKHLAEVFHHALAMEQQVRLREEESHALTIDADARTEIAYLTEDALVRYEAMILPEVTLNQRLAEVTKAIENEVLSPQEGDELLERLRRGEDIGDSARRLLDILSDSSDEDDDDYGESNLPPREEDNYV